MADSLELHGILKLPVRLDIYLNRQLNELQFGCIIFTDILHFDEANN